MIALFAVPAFAVGVGFSAAMFFRWRLGFYGLLLYLPFAGTVTLFLYPSDLPKIFKDLLFVVPLYLILGVAHLSEFRSVRIPQPVLLAMSLLTTLVLFQTVNPNVVSLAVALVGVKVWLLYLPLVFVTFALIRNRTDLTLLTRLLVAIVPIPCGLGLLQYAQISATGLVPTMTWYYGDAAWAASFRFAIVPFGGITLYRIPSTFPFITQYFGYILAMLVPAYFVLQADPNRKWRIYGGAVLVLLVIAGFLSGARAAFVMIPPLLALFAILEGRIVRLSVGALISALVMAIAVNVAGFDINQLLDDVHARAVSERGTKAPVVDDFLEALHEYPLGTGTGTNTLGARNVTEDGITPSGLETYYGKSIVELGIAGLFVVVFLFLAVLGSGLRQLPQIHDPGLRSLCGAIVGFVVIMMINSLKGFQLDMDPINVYFWVFAGLLFRIRSLDQGETSRLKLPALTRNKKEFPVSA